MHKKEKQRASNTQCVRVKIPIYYKWWQKAEHEELKKTNHKCNKKIYKKKNLFNFSCFFFFLEYLVGWVVGFLRFFFIILTKEKLLIHN